GRNAIFHDLIDHSWPVTYNYQGLPYENAIFGNTGILDYYFAFWLPGAWIGKIAGFKIASIFMLLYQTIGVILFFYLVCRFMKNIKYRCFFIFLAFGGLDVIINVIVSVMNHVPIQPFGMKHIDTSSAPFCMSTFVTQLFWVFNQSLPTWLAVMYFLQQKDFKTCGYLFALVVPYGPFPMMGFLYLIFCYIIFGKKLNKLLNWKRFKSLLTVPNFFGVIAILPIAFMYTLNKSQKGLVFMRASHNGTLNTTLLLYLIFFILEFFVYIIIINKKNWKELLVCFAFFAIAPLFYVGGFDLGNRSTIPLLILLYILIVQFLDKLDRRQVNIYWRQILCIVILCIAFATNFNEIHRAIYNTYFDYKYHYSNITDKYKTFDEFEGKEVAPFITNFVVPYQEDNKILTLLYRENPVLKEEEIVSKENEKLKTYHNWVNVSKYNVTTKTIDTIRFKMNGVVRGKKAAKIVKESLINDEKALYEYQTPKKGYEWVVFKYDLDLDGFQLGEYGTSASIEFKVFLKNQSSSLETINLNPSDLVMDTKLSGMYAVQLPIGENDYFISVGNTKGNYVLFQDEKK
ncbi:MAG: hypothetical protein KH135_02485, partial [Firmicutes bacterium]|nr:hypothetical protein [Bacillota bacterium]